MSSSPTSSTEQIDAQAPSSVSRSGATKPSTSSNVLAVIPLELKCRIASFLSPQEAIRISDVIGITVSSLQPSRRLFTTCSWNGDRLTGDTPVATRYNIPVQNAPIHSATVQFRWRDQGWGNRKGQVYIIATLKDAEAQAVDLTLPFRGGRVVCTSELAPQATEDYEMTFCPRETENYTLWYKAGGGGGHRLLLQNFTVKTVIFDDAEHNWTHNYRTLYELGVIGMELPREEPDMGGFFFQNMFGENERAPREAAGNASSRQQSMFYPKMLLRVCKSLRRQLAEGTDDDLDPDLLDFMNDYKIPVTSRSLRTVEEIVQADLEERQAAAVQEPLQQNNAANNGQGPQNLHQDNDPAAFLAGMLGVGALNGAMFGVGGGDNGIMFALGQGGPPLQADQMDINRLAREAREAQRHARERHRQAREDLRQAQIQLQRERDRLQEGQQHQNQQPDAEMPEAMPQGFQDAVQAMQEDRQEREAALPGEFFQEFHDAMQALQEHVEQLGPQGGVLEEVRQAVRDIGGVFGDAALREDDDDDDDLVDVD